MPPERVLPPNPGPAVGTARPERAAAPNDGAVARLLRNSPLIVFVAVEIFALVLYLVRGHHLWFWTDEWEFLTTRTAGRVDDVFGGHNGHPSMLPVLSYRLLWQFFGLRTYVPYQLVVILLHLGTAALLRAVMVRAGANPWLATAGASAFALFTIGYQNILWGFQVGYTGSLFFGLLALLLADHERGWSRRDVFAFAAAVASLACSNAAIPMVVAATIAVLVRRGWRAAAVFSAPLAALFIAWWQVWGHKTEDSKGGGIRATISFAYNLLRSTTLRFTESTSVAIVLITVFAVGLILAASRARDARVRARLAAPFGLLIGGALYVSLTAAQRSSNPPAASASRYMHTALVFVLPALVVAFSYVARYGRVAFVVVFVLLILGIPPHVTRFPVYLHRPVLEASTFKRDLLAVPSLPGIDTVGPKTRLLAPRTSIVPLGWLLHSAADGKVPKPVDRSAETIGFAELRSSFVGVRYPLPAAYRCQVVRDRAHLVLGPLELLYVLQGMAEMRPDIQPAPTRSIEIGPVSATIRGPTRLTLSPGPSAPLRICAPPHSWGAAS